MNITHVFDLHYQQFLVQIEGTEAEAIALKKLLEETFVTGKDGKSHLKFLILCKK